ncbi:MAG: SDR family oxidoreductase [Oscillospiraceae bacterium]|jgi:3-oxoacyl-[acyl-carrier protein] reductase|nr:SDR family oxidoreductase [Oscillospiraceae bacterium]
MKTALITGGARGIGVEICRALARDGYRVAINYATSRNAAQSLASELGGIAVCADVTDPRAVSAMFGAIGDVDALVCNAAIAQYGVFQDIAADWRRVFDVNFGGTVNVINAALPAMIREKSGAIVTVSSVWGVRGASCESIYAASKSAVIGLTKSLALELAPSGIRVNCVAPAMIGAGMTTDAFGADDLDALRDRVPLGKLGTAQDVAEAVSWLCSDRAGYVTGQVLEVGGGG